MFAFNLFLPIRSIIIAFRERIAVKYKSKRPCELSPVAGGVDLAEKETLRTPSLFNTGRSMLPFPISLVISVPLYVTDFK